MIRKLAILVVIGIAAKVWGPFHIDYNVLEVAAIIAGAAAITYFGAWRETEMYRARMANYLEAKGLLADFAYWARGPSQPSPYFPAGDSRESRPSTDEPKEAEAPTAKGGKATSTGAVSHVACSSCGRPMRTDATTCGYCWTKVPKA